jgi:uncharacterized protein YjeT (DUF2065 family)
MDVGITIARTMGPVLVILGLWFFLVPEIAKKGLVNLKEMTGFQYTYGLIHFILGFFIIAVHNVWESNIFLSVTLLGWVLVLRGILLWFMPGKYLKNRVMGSAIIQAFKYIVLIWGIILLYAGFRG